MIVLIQDSPNIYVGPAVLHHVDCHFRNTVDKRTLNMFAVVSKENKRYQYPRLNELDGSTNWVYEAGPPISGSRTCLLAWVHELDPRPGFARGPCCALPLCLFQESSPKRTWPYLNRQVCLEHFIKPRKGSKPPTHPPKFHA